MEKNIKITKEYLYIPIQIEASEKLIEIFLKDADGTEKKELEFMIPVGKSKNDIYPCDYVARFPVKKFTDKTLTLRGDVPEAFLREVRNDSFKEYEPLERPSIHFTAMRSWINDPNGLCYKDGVYHLYFQYNPFSTKWNNMSWGHAVSKDLLYWKEKDPVLFPDEHGMIFSGSAIQNRRGCLGLSEDALICFYTAAGGSNEWGKDKFFTQKIAFSLDNGETLRKTEIGALDVIEKENRDPKVFWHEPTKSYIMCLWLEKNDFAILRSEDLTDFKMTHRFSLEEAWECPDLFPLFGENGKEQWVFWSADGFYYFGSFDGYQFLTDGVRHNAYMNKVPYAAQTYSGVENRVISVPWLRLEFKNRLYTGAMGIPREFHIVEINGEIGISQFYTREFMEHRKKMDISLMEGRKYKLEVEVNTAVLVEIRLDIRKKGTISLDLCGMRVIYDGETGMFSVGEESFHIGKKIEDFSFLVDDTIFEVSANHSIIVGIFELIRMHSFLRMNVDDVAEWNAYSVQ